MSLLSFFESRGAVYRSVEPWADGLQILRNQGLNCVRLRLFTSSAAQAQSDPYNRVNNLEYTLPLAVRVKNAGLSLMLDFHYSDTWADPGHQAKPAAWRDLPFSNLVEQVRAYNSNSISSFRTAGVLPEYVQIGNEITSGLLWPDGHVGGTDDRPSQWSKLGLLVKAAIAGVRDGAVDAMPRIMIHIDRGGDWAGTQWFFDHLIAQDVEFDVIGQSYYPFWHGSLSSLATCLSNTVARYGKPVLIAETAFPWQGPTNIYGIPPTPAGQVQFVTELARIVKRLPGQLGAGVVWWGTEYQTISGLALAGFDRRSFFDASGDVLPVAYAFGQLCAPLVLSSLTSAGELKLSWPLSGAGMTLFTADQVERNQWTPVEGNVSISDLSFRLTVPLPHDQTRFYRLQSN